MYAETKAMLAPSSSTTGGHGCPKKDWQGLSTGCSHSGIAVGGFELCGGGRLAACVFEVWADDRRATTPKNTDWPKAEIEKLARSSGKPLEVLCAQTFLRNQWKASLGSYYQDGSKTRELDVLAERELVLQLPLAFTVRVRALVSCRGFPAEQSPLVYSVSTECVPSFTPMLLGGHRRPQISRDEGPMPRIEQEGANELLRSSKLNAARPIVALDLIEREEKPAKGKRPADVSFNFKRKGDREIFESIDSCVSAAQAWVHSDYRVPNEPFALNVPVCLLSVPFWDVCIDDGKIGAPEIKRRGYQTFSFPNIIGRAREVMTVIWQLKSWTAWFLHSTTFSLGS